MSEGFDEENNEDNFDDLQRACANLMSVETIHLKWRCQSKGIQILVINTASITDSGLPTVYKKKIAVVACIEFTDL